MLWGYVMGTYTAKERLEIIVEPQEYVVRGKGGVECTKTTCFDVRKDSWCAKRVVNYS